MPNTTVADYHEANRASEVLSKIGSGAADADFARAIHQAIDRVMQTEKKARVRVEVEIMPSADNGALILRSRVTAKLPELPLPASQMHVGAGGQLLTQMDWLMGGGRDERPATPVEQANAAAKAEAQGQPSSPSGRFAVVKPPAPPAVAPPAAPAPLATTPAQTPPAA